MAAADRPVWPAMALAQVDAALTAAGSPFEVGEATIAGVSTRIWQNAPPTLREVLALARSYGDRTFMVHEEERIEFQAFVRAAVTMAKRLQADGIGVGDRVAVAMRNLPEWPVAFFGASLVGAVVAPLNAWWTAQELAFGLTDSGAKAAIFDAERFDRYKAIGETFPNLACLYTARCDSGDPAVARMEDIVGPSSAWSSLPDDPLTLASFGPDDDAVIFYTSGTSGKPKGALATHRGVTCNVVAAAYAVARSYLRRGEALPTPGATPQKTYLCGIPFFHVTGFCALLQVTLAHGYRVVTMHRWDAGLGLALIQRERITHVGGVPTLVWQLIQHPDRAAYDLSSVEVVSYGGAPAAPELVRQVHLAFPNAQPGFGWGMSETCATFTIHMGEDYDHRPDSAGPPMPVGQLRIVGADGGDLPVGEVGEVLAKGPNIIRGYWNNPQATAEAITDGWLHTGDLGRVDAEGFLYIVDRAKDMIIRGGENIYCIEVENVLFEHPAVADVVLQAIPHPTLGEEPGAVVVLKPGRIVTQTQLQDFVRSRLAAFKVPVKIAFSQQPLPRNANGKVLKAEVREILARSGVSSADG